MDHPLFLPLAACTHPGLVGGKAAGLARLIANGFHVPLGLCVTTEASQLCLEARGFSLTARWDHLLRVSAEDRPRLLADCQTIIRNVECSDLIAQVQQAVGRLDQPANTLWAIRSSATNEDAAHASFAGLYRTHLGVTLSGIEGAIKDLWASVWDERVVRYCLQLGLTGTPPAMAVIIQPMLDAQVAGVAYSVHPLTGRANAVMVNAVPGLAASLVEGTVTPDQYVLRVRHDAKTTMVVERIIAKKERAIRLTAHGVREEAILPGNVERSSLTDEQLNELARVTKEVEQALHTPVDIEWVIDGRELWLLQARPITHLPGPLPLTNDDCEWSRANFKETLPELPSPLGLSFLERFMEAYIIAPYRRLGCTIPVGVTSVRTLHGRPYINMTLMHSLTLQLRGAPSLVTEQMGGESLATIPEVQPLGWGAYIRAGVLSMREMGKALKYGPAWCREMKGFAVLYQPDRVRCLTDRDISSRLDDLERWLDTHELTFGIAGGVSLCLQALGTFLPRWLGEDWRALLNAALQGQGSVISAQQIVRLAELAEIARCEPAVVRMLTADASALTGFRQRLNGTEFLRAFDRYLEDYGHRGIGESDVMSPRFADQPELLLSVLRAQLLAPVNATSADILARQASMRAQALVEIRRRFGWCLHRWLIFIWWYRRLGRFFALREANRHHLMYYSAAVRNLLLRLGELLVEGSVFVSRDEIFFLTLNERADLSADRQRDWREIVRGRRAERERQILVTVPDTIREWTEVCDGHEEFDTDLSEKVLRGIPISAGSVLGPARLVRSMADWGKVRAGNIIVTSVIDPGMAPLFVIAAGLVAEMGGTLSHGAIIAREYGLPAIVNVSGATARIREGDSVIVNAMRGEVVVQGETEFTS
jgi:rifampicin phosphotransferase